MAIFRAQESSGGNTVPWGTTSRRVEIAFIPGSMQMQGKTYVMSQPLSSETEIDAVVENLIEELEKAGAEAKKLLKP